MASSTSYDRLSELKAFDATKAGVKGLVDAGVTAVPRIFHHPVPARAAEPETPSTPNRDVGCSSSRVPVIDLAAAKSDLVAQVKAAAGTVGFFQVTNHGVPAELLAEMLASVKRFHEEPKEAKAPYYTREPGTRVAYQSNFDLFVSPAANWRDTLFMVAAPPPLEEVPPACRDALPDYTRQVKRLGGTLLELLSEALGLHGGYLERDAGGLDGVDVVCHYYPPCPEPHLTMGTPRHSDPSFLTVLLQDGVGGLQVLLDGSWVDVPPVPGALVVNIGDLLQLISNDRFKSVEHRVVAMDTSSRVSVACFFRKRDDSRVHSPIIMEPGEERQRYRSITVEEYLDYYTKKGLDGRSALEHFRL